MVDSIACNSISPHLGACCPSQPSFIVDVTTAYDGADRAASIADTSY